MPLIKEAVAPVVSPFKKVNRWILLTWLIALGVITWASLKQNKDFPPPSKYLGSSIVYSILAVLAEAQPDLARVMAVGVTLGLGYAYVGGRAQGASQEPLGAPQNPSQVTQKAKRTQNRQNAFQTVEGS